MRPVVLGWLALLLMGCEAFPDLKVVPRNIDGSDLGCSKPDLALSGANCAAAKGLSGDALVCVDFNRVSMPDQLPDWDFSLPCDGVGRFVGGRLQIDTFARPSGSCSFSLPLMLLSQLKYYKYRSFTVAVVQQMGQDPNIHSEIFFGLDEPNNLIDFSGGTQRRQRRSITVELDDLPSRSFLQPLFKLVWNKPSSPQSWLIESIAVVGNM